MRRTPLERPNFLARLDDFSRVPNQQSRAMYAADLAVSSASSSGDFRGPVAFVAISDTLRTKVGTTHSP